MVTMAIRVTIAREIGKTNPSAPEPATARITKISWVA
jgi:hypothetical protein